ncbi:monooxygenase, variant 3 [Perkinsus olseni]|uniref:Monooxygenase, variant 3 n=2 Tax=Perkinsus olseni TaxID=32597 RepID=A0A7J6Q684_PEROL|nr:monooxygenase, variant 3 [Perkinsus olseni]
MSARPRSICIIGAGAGGLITARTILNQKWADRVVLLEKRPNVGGVWDYERNGGTKTSAMYHSLRTNLPKEVMQFRDFPFPSDLPSFIPRAAVQRYLEDFADNGKLREYIKFNAEAVKVERIGDGHWRVTWREHHLRDLSGFYDSSFFSEEFSGVCICNGHFDVPHIPEEFRGLPNVVHSRMYDGPEPFEGQNVCIIGTGPSSADIAYEVGMVAKSMTVVGRHHKGEAMVSTRGTLVRGLDRSELLGFDTVLLCTGYEYYFPFLDGMETDVGEHLLELMMWPNDPTLIFIGLPSGVVVVRKLGFR